MNFRNYFLFLVILITINVNAQLIIEAKNSVSGQKFMIEINENPQKYYIATKIFDSISTIKNHELENLQREYFNLKNKSIEKDSVQSVLEKIKLFKEKNSYYTTYKTEVEKKDFEKFDALIKLFKTQTPDFFERKNENKNRITADGTIVKIDVHDNEKVRNIWSYSPDEKSNPEIKDLVTSSLDLLRNKGILSKDKKITVGY